MSQLRGVLAETNIEKAEPFAMNISSTYSPESPEYSTLSSCSTYLSSKGFIIDEVLQALRVVKPHRPLGSDSSHPVILKELGPVIAPTLAEISSQSLTLARPPAQRETAHIFPLFKGDARVDPVNYRPVSLTCATGKIIERVTAHQLRNHLLSNQLLCSEKHGRSCI